MPSIYIGKDKLGRAFIGGQEYTKIYMGPTLIWTSHTHSYVLTKSVASTCTTHGYSTYTCECGDSYNVTKALLSHSYTYSITKEPDCTNSGEKQGVCVMCGKTTTTSIPATRHTYIDGYCSECGYADPDWSPNYYTVSITCHYSTALEDTWCEDCYVSLEYLNPYSEIGWDDFSDTYNFGETKQIDLPEGTKLGLVIVPGDGDGGHYYNVVINNNWSFDLNNYSLYDNLDIHIYVED